MFDDQIPGNYPKHINVQKDSRGVSYVLGPDGTPRYLTSVEDARQNGSNGLLHNKEWNPETGTWDSKTNWGNILGLGVAGVIGGAAAAPAFGAGGAAAPEIGYSSAPMSAVSTPGVVGATTGATTAAGGTVGSTASTLSKVLGKIKGVSSVLGGASKDEAATRAANTRSQLDWDKLNLVAPAEKTKSALAAAMLQNYTPRTVSWGGPGSGLRGEVPTYSGGSSAALAKASQDPMLKQLLSDVMAGKAGVPNPTDPGQPGHESVWDKILGAGAFGSSLLGALG